MNISKVHTKVLHLFTVDITVSTHKYPHNCKSTYRLWSWFRLSRLDMEVGHHGLETFFVFC